MRPETRGSLGDALTYLRDSVLAIVRARHSLIMLTAVVLIMLWGKHGELPLLRAVVPGWVGAGNHGPERGVLIPGLPWDQEWLSFLGGVVLLLVVPCAIIRLGFRERLRDYGLGWARSGQGRFTLVSALLLAAFAYPSMYQAAQLESMRAVYPLFRNFASVTEFCIYELGYCAFFLVIEFAFRGYLLLGLYGTEHAQGTRGARESQDPPLLSHYSIVVSMLSYTAWHLGKPQPELFSTFVWGVVAGAIVLRSGTIWVVFGIHWSMNAMFDYLIWRSAP